MYWDEGCTGSWRETVVVCTEGTGASSNESFVCVLHIERGHCYAKYSPSLFHYKIVPLQMKK